MMAGASQPKPAPRSGSPCWIRLTLTLVSSFGAILGALMIAFFWGRVWGWAGVVILALAIAAWAANLRLPRSPDRGRPAGRRYVLRVALTMGVAYPLLFLSALWLYKRGLTHGLLGYLIAAAPALPLVGMILIFRRFLREETDEVLRAGLLSALVWSGALTLCEASVWGFLETFGKAPNVWMWTVPLAFFAQLGVTMPLAQRRYS
jgi:hypothetical protein